MKKLLRVKSKQDFQEVISSSHKFSCNSFVVFCLKREEYDYPRYGIAASKKLGDAVIRVKVRRQIRAMIDEMTRELDIIPMDYVIIAKTNYLRKTYQENLKEMKTLYKKIGGKFNEQN